MNNRTYIAFASVLVILASCSKHSIDSGLQVPDSSRSYIFFEPEVLDITESKASLIEGDELPAAPNTAFGVLGYYGANKTSIFTGYSYGIARVYRPSEGDTFLYDNLASWQKGTPTDTDKNHYFYAFYPFDLSSSVIPNNANPYISYTLPAEAEMMDILTAMATYDTKVPNVALGFQHRLWALDFEIKNEQTDNPYNPGTGDPSQNLSVISAKITFNNFPTQGKLYIKNSADVVDAREVKEIILKARSQNTPTGDEVIGSGTSKEFSPLLFFPTLVSIPDSDNKVQYRIELELRNPWGVEYSFSYPSANTFADFKSTLTSFEAGKRYSLKVTKGNGDSFTVSVGDVLPWETTDDIDHTFN